MTLRERRGFQHLNVFSTLADRRHSGSRPGLASVHLVMSQSRQMALVLITAVVIAAVGSHLLASWLKVKTIASQPVVFGKPNGKPPAFLAGSSIMAYGISWEQISTQLDLEIKVWGIAAGSPVEFEQFQKQVPDARTTFIVVSAVDLDEAVVSDFRAAIVPLGQTIQTLRETDANWKDSMHALNQYPMTWLRTLFPTLGRSRGIMGMLRQNAANWIKPSSSTSARMAGPTINFGKDTDDDEYKRQRMSDWPESKVIGKLSAIQADFDGPHSYDGVKRMAFERMLQYGCHRGRTIVVVMPVSPAYSREFMPPETAKKFEQAIIELQRGAPQSEWLRFDQLPGLAVAENFCDLDHLNVFGKRIATEALQARLEQPAHQP